MTDAELEALYKSGMNASHTAALRAVFDAGKASVPQVTSEAAPEPVALKPLPVFEPEDFSAIDETLDQ